MCGLIKTRGQGRKWNPHWLAKRHKDKDCLCQVPRVKKLKTNLDWVPWSVYHFILGEAELQFVLMVLVYSWSSMRILPPWRIQNCLFRNDDTFNVGYRTAYPILTLYPLVNIYKLLLFHTPGNLLSIASLWSFFWFPFDFPSTRGTNSKKVISSDQRCVRDESHPRIYGHPSSFLRSP